jgi:diguanylate cyclase (GGDEF)-like protein
MRRAADLRRSLLRQFLPYAGATLTLVLVIGAVLAIGYRGQAHQRGLSRGQAEAALVAQTAVEPILNGHALDNGITASEKADLTRLASRAVVDHSVLRLRVRTLAGQVVFSDDGSGFAQKPEDEALYAANGHVVARLTRLNGDTNDTGTIGVPAVEVYLPLAAGKPLHRVGVLEIYLPYAPIAADINVGLRSTYRDLGLALAGLYVGLLVLSASVTRRLRREVARNAFMAEHDGLTGLPNRALFHRRIEAALGTRRRRREPIAIAILDLDRFKAVNDTLGHHNGDELLVRLAERLQHDLRRGDTVARLGGDEFGLILRSAVEPSEALNRVREIIEEVVEVRGIPLAVEASIGYVVAPADGSDVDDLLQKADVAMYAAKTQGLGALRYSPGQDRYDAASLALVAELRGAIERDELVLHYQPKVRLSDGSVEAVEALVRWEHPVHGLLYPDRFLPLAEQTNLIDRLTDWVMHRALQDLAAWNLPDMSVAVNVSARNLIQDDFATRAAALLSRLGVEPERLILELTETALLADPARAAEALGELAATGVRISIDDFGQGQSSLSYLTGLPVHEIKIDKGFVTDLADNATHAAIVRSVVDLGHNLGFRVVGEGVEDDLVRLQLASAGCDWPRATSSPDPCRRRQPPRG